MEFKLNKIDTDVQNIINEQTKDGKVHSKKDVELDTQVLKDKKNRYNNRQREKKKEAFSISKYEKGNKTIQINAYKYKTIEVDAEKERNKDSDKGLFVDIRK